MTFKSKIFATLDTNPALADQPTVFREMFDCAPATVRDYTSRWRKRQACDWALDSAVEPRDCPGCEHGSVCRHLAFYGYPVLCERVTRKEQMVYVRRGVWGDVLRSRVEVGG